MLTHKLQEGQIVRSKAGRDCGRYYVILSWTKRDVFVANGTKYKLSQPKRKNARHVWYTKSVSSIENDEIIERVLKEFDGR